MFTMFENVHEIAVLVSAILAMAVGSIWYSPLLFGKHWMRAAGLKESDLDSQKDKIVRLMVYAFIANLVLLFVVAKFVGIAQAAGETIKSVGTLLVILLGAMMAGAVIWEERPISYLFINVGYATVIIFGGMSVIWYWPW